MRTVVIPVLALVPALAATALDSPRAKPLPGNKACAYPAEAQKQYVAGSVSFRVVVRPDGSPESVEVREVPLPDLGFEDAVRACASGWRFEPAAAGETAARGYEGAVRFRLQPAEEAAIRAQLETLAAAWNAGDLKAVDELAWQPGDGPLDPPAAARPLSEQLEAWPAPPRPWRMDLEPEWEHVRFIRPDLAGVRQRFGRSPAWDANEQTLAGEEPLVDALMAKGPRGWRFVRAKATSRAWLGAVRAGVTIPEPRKLKSAPPHYPEAAKLGRIQGLVVLDCVISPEGKVTNVRVLRSRHKLLDAAAIEAVRQLEFAPTLVDGKAVAVVMTVPVSFTLKTVNTPLGSPE